MKELKHCILEQKTIPPDQLERIAASFESREIRKGDFFLHAGGICREMAFIRSGYMRMFDLAEGKEITLWIGKEGSFITSLSSFVFGTANHWNIQAITDCGIEVISRERHEQLLKLIPQWLEFDNLLLARSFALLERSMFSQLHTTALQRFQTFMDEQGEMINHVPLQYIASMLGMTPETLSRLRKSMASKTS